MMRREQSGQQSKKIDASVVDLFCGAGGLSHGFYQEGFQIAAGIDIDEDCRYAYEENNDAPFICKDVSELSDDDLHEVFAPNGHRILVGCAPCQPFSTYNQKNKDPSWRLLSSFGKLIKTVRPSVVSMENVPRLLNFKDGTIFLNFVKMLKDADYQVSFDILYGPDYGLPQGRSRLVLLASNLGEIQLPKPTHKGRHRTVRDVLFNLPHLDAGDTDSSDPLHKASRLNGMNRRRIRAAKPGGSWNNWDKDIVTPCHKKETGKGYVSVYGRMEWDKPSPTITTQFFGFGNGRFGHPEQDRALSLREGAILQGFPKNYKFVAPGDRVYMKTLGRLIGNAVPVTLSKAIANSIKLHIAEYS